MIAIADIIIIFLVTLIVYMVLSKKSKRNIEKVEYFDNDYSKIDDDIYKMYIGDKVINFFSEERTPRETSEFIEQLKKVLNK